MSPRSVEALRLSPEQLTSAAARIMTETSSENWKDGSDSPPAVSSEAVSWMQTDTDRPLQDPPSATLTLGGSPSSAVHTDIHGNSSFPSTTVSRAGERTLLSVTSSSSNSSSPAFTEDTMSHQPHSTWAVSAAASETEDYTPSGTSAGTDFTATEQNMTLSLEGTVSETESTGRPAGTRSVNTQPHVTQHQHQPASEERSDSTPPLRLSATSTSRPEPAWTSSAPASSHTQASTNVSMTDRETFESSTESLALIHFSSTRRPEGTEMVPPRTSGQTGGLDRTAGPPAAGTATPEEHSAAATQVVSELVHTSTLASATQRYL